MASILAPLRRNLEFHPSRVAHRRGLLIGDPYRCAEGSLILPPRLAVRSRGEAVYEARQMGLLD